MLFKNGVKVIKREIVGIMFPIKRGIHTIIEERNGNLDFFLTDSWHLLIIGRQD